MAPASRHDGFTLVELMVSMAIGLVISAALFSAFIAARGTQRTQEMLLEVQQAGRAAVDLLTYDLRMAGSLGLTPSWSSEVRAGPVTLADDCFTSATQSFDWATALALTGGGDKPPVVYGEDDVPASGAPALFECIPSDGSGSAVVPGSDVLSVHYLAPEAIPPSSLEAGGVYAETGIGGTEIFQCPAGRSGTDCRAAPAGGRELREVVSRLFYLRPWAVDEGDGIPTLVSIRHRRGVRVVEPLVEGVGALQIRYGVDTDADGFVDRFMSADELPALDRPVGAVSDWSRVKAVRVALMAQSVQQDHREGDGTVQVQVGERTVTVPRALFTRVFTFTVAVRNPRDAGAGAR